MRAVGRQAASVRAVLRDRVSYLKDSFLLGRGFIDLADMNAQVRHWLEHTANVRAHATTNERPADLLLKENLAILTSIAPYPISAFVNRKVGSESFIHFGGSRYSVPPKYVGMNVDIVLMDDRVMVRTADPLFQTTA